ncbi:MAG: SOS response-associated peptidase family protein [Albidovulum sp.]|uniref:SOS response-associated peptidase n=1 Tax=Albidovulum sp. TaxID=1872424 RepID=UPI003C882221
MSRRTSPQYKTDDRAFPVRIKVLIPEFGLSTLSEDPWRWLDSEIGRGEYATTGARCFIGDAMVLYFRCLEDAGRFMDAFPLPLADDTMASVYSSPALPFGREEEPDVCNLFSSLKPQEAMRRLFSPRPLIDHAGNLPPLPGVYPDQMAPVVRQGSDGLELTMARWGLPTPPQYLVGKKTDRGVTNVRNTRSPHWRRWLAPEHRCLVPFDAFAEPIKGGNVWFHLKDERPAFFAGIYVPVWTSIRKVKDGETTDNLFGFLTTDPNAEVGPIHPKAMPVILTDPEKWDTWLQAPWTIASELQKPLQDGVLKTFVPS